MLHVAVIANALLVGVCLIMRLRSKQLGDVDNICSMLAFGSLLLVWDCNLP